MSRRLASLTLDNLDDLPRRCRQCVFWELDPVARDIAEDAGDVELEKEAWVSATLLEWGSCGKIVYVDSYPAGYVLYAPPVSVPRSVAFPTSPVSGDAVLLMTAMIAREFRGGGLGRMLVQSAAKDLSRRGVRAIEAFGSLQPGDPSAPAAPAAPAGRADQRRDADDADDAADADDADDADDAVASSRRRDRRRGPCVVPADYLLAVGFKTVRPHHRYPRLRLDLKNALSWREDVEVALERLLGSMNPEPVFRPV